MNKDSLGDRMKAYENVNRVCLPRRMPLIIRIDGKAFHTFTRGFEKPFDTYLTGAMWDTAAHLCQKIEGCRLAYTQSDEISLLLTDYEKLETQPWFGKNLQKIVSVASSIATATFNTAFSAYVGHLEPNNIYESRIGRALFDARAFILPKEEVCNYFIWRQQDAIRNSIQMVGQANFSHKELQNKSCAEIQKMLLDQCGIDWNDLPPFFQRGSCIVKHSSISRGVERLRWRHQITIPVFSEDRAYIENLL